MVYLVLKDLAAVSEDVIIAIAILTKDIASNVDVYRANAIRVISRIIDSGMLQQVERYIKTALVDKDTYVQASALVSSLHLMGRCSDIVKKWGNEIQDALQSRSPQAQYLALALLHQIRAADPMAINKLVHTLTRSGSVRSPLAQCLLIRYAARVVTTDVHSGARDPALFEFLEGCLRNRSEIVVYEAAKQIVDLPKVNARELESTVAVLQSFLGSTKAVLRFAAVKTLNRIAFMFPQALAGTASFEMENLITDVNRSVATLAVTTLLQVESESSVDRLLKQIASFIVEVSDEYKVVVVDALRALAFKYKTKHQAVMNVLSAMLRDEGGFDYKKKIVDTFVEIISSIPEAKERGLAHLCEFIEDCEFTYLSTKILHLLGAEGPRTKNPGMYVRYIYNRIILENSAVRAAAVNALAQFGERESESIQLLLRHAKEGDHDDQVRDRATWYLALLEERSRNDSFDFVGAMNPRLAVPLENLESALNNYLRSSQTEPFDISTVPAEVIAPAKPNLAAAAKDSHVPLAAAAAQAAAATGVGAGAAAAAAAAQAALEVKLPDDFKALGKLFKTTAPEQLTEQETEFQVSVMRHVFGEAGVIVFQFNITNTLEVQAIGNVTVQLAGQGPDAAKFKVVKTVPCAKKLLAGESGHSFTAVKLPVPAEVNTGCTFRATMKFDAYDVDSGEIDEGSQFQDTYQINNLEVRPADYIKKIIVNNFAAGWDQLTQENEGLVTFALATAKGIKEAVAEILQYLGMQPCDRSEEVPDKRTKHILYAGGQYLNSAPLLARARMKLNSPDQGGVAVELCVRSQDVDLATAIANGIISS
jgi:coatomer subunit gamma